MPEEAKQKKELTSQTIKKKGGSVGKVQLKLFEEAMEKTTKGFSKIKI